MKNNPEEELSEGLRAAVEQVRAEPIPTEAMEGCLARAQRLERARPAWWRRHHRALASAVAALLVLGLAVPHLPLGGSTGPSSSIPLPRTQSGWVMESPPEKDLTNTDLGLDDRVELNYFTDRIEEVRVDGKVDPSAPIGMEGAPGEAPQNVRGVGLLGLGDSPPGEAYSRIVETGFRPVVRHPLSTFSVSVDTASYSNVRRFLVQEGRLPPPDAVRIEEMVNYFPYAYARPNGQHPVAFTLGVAGCPWQPRHKLVRIALAAKTLDPTKLPPRNLVFLVDTSGSMRPANRLPLLKTSLRLLVEQLTDRDRVALVAYAGSAGLVLPSTKGSDKRTILAAIDRLDAGGSTNGGEGIVLAYKVAQESFIRGGVNRVLLGTDGDFNVGVTDEKELVRLIENKRKTGVFLTILGFGMGNLKDATLEKLASHGNGHYAYVDTLAEARKVFVEQGAALVVVAKDVKLQVEFNPARVAGYRLVGYENRRLKAKDFNDDRKDAGDMGAGHTVTALYEIVPAGQGPGPAAERLRYQVPAKVNAAHRDEWLVVRLRYKEPDLDTSKLLEQPLAGPAVPFAFAPPDFRFAAGVASFGMVLRRSPLRGSSSYDSALEIARGARGVDPGGHRAELLTLIARADAIARQAGKR